MGFASDIVSITISRATTTVDRATFSVPLLLSYHANFAGRTKQYAASTILTDLVTDGFATSDPAYLMASKVVEQNPRPPVIKVGRLANAPTQIVTCTPIPPAVAAVRKYKATINGTDFEFTTDATPTDAEIVTGINALINAGPEPVTASGTTTMILTADVPGDMFTLLLDDDSDGENLWNREDDTADASVAANMAAIVLEDNDWYGLLYEGHGVAIQTILATWAETAKKLFMATTADDDTYDPGESDDIASVVSAASRDRTITFFHDVPHSYPGCAWMGRMFSIDPGASTWDAQNLSGPAAVELSSAQMTALDDKVCNYYTLLAGSNRTQDGRVASDEWIDTIRFIDWFEVNLQADYLELKFAKSDAGSKIPYTGDGIVLEENVLWQRIQAGIDAGGLAADKKHTVTVPDIQDVSSSDKNNRILNDITFVAFLAGAIHKVAITGVMTT